MRLAPAKSLSVGLGAVLFAALPPFWASAQTAPTATMNVTATVYDQCSVSTTDLAFGNYVRAQLDQTATITADCTSGTSYEVGLNAGTAAGATTTNRSMTGSPGGSLLNYVLYSDAGRSTNWGDIGESGTVTGTGSGGPDNITVYGRIPAGQFVPAGSYSDTITVTLNY